MKFIAPSLATAALALVASAAPAAEVTKALPARFAMQIVTAEARANGLRILYGGSGPDFKINLNLDTIPGVSKAAVPGVFLGGGDRITLDPAVHPATNGESGAFNVILFQDASAIPVRSEQMQALYTSWGGRSTPLAGKWVQDNTGILRRLGADGALQPNGVRLCGSGEELYQVWWGTTIYEDCPEAKLKIVAL